MISIIISIYNSENTLHNCLNSILKQTYFDFEVICFNDASTDSSKEILEYFALKDSRIKIINNETTKGEHYCKTKGLELSNGKYVTFIKSDEWIISSTLEILIKHAEDNQLDIIFYNNNNINIKEFEILTPSDLDETKIEILKKEWNKFYLKSILTQNNFIKIFSASKRISLINTLFKQQHTLKDYEPQKNILSKQHLIQLKNQLNMLESSIQKQQKQTNEYINLQKDLNKHILKRTNIIHENYNEYRTAFFNNQEEKLKKYFDTDELFRICFFNNFKFVSYSPAENRILIKTDEDILFGTNNRFHTVKEVIGFNGYSIPQLYDFDEFVVFDIGMNRAYASLWFAKFNNCKSVYGFEIDPETYTKALSNINLNPTLANKITPYNFGLSNENEEVDLYYIKGCDGINTMFNEVVNLQSEFKDKNKLNTKKVNVKKANEVLSHIIKTENITSKIVLKIDTEGAEYNIIKNLIDSNIISKIDVLLGEGHLFEREHYCDKLKEMGFEQIELQINPVTYNFAFVKEEHFNIWHLKE